MALGRTRFLLRFVFSIAAAIAIAFPLVCGPMIGAIVTGEQEHTCLCGMKAGECGCPDCIAVEKQRVDDRRATHPIVRSSCNDPEAIVGPSLPTAIASAITAIAEAPRGERISVLAPPSWSAQITHSPPTPPPRG